MKSAQLKSSKYYLLWGIGGLVISMLLTYLFEFQTPAPNEATLIYWQTRWTPLIVIVFGVSLITLLRGIWQSIQEWRGKWPPTG